MIRFTDLEGFVHTANNFEVIIGPFKPFKTWYTMWPFGKVEDTKDYSKIVARVGIGKGHYYATEYEIIND